MAKIFRLVVLGFLTCLSAGAQDAAVPRSQEELAWEVYGIFHRHCSDCHGGHRSNPKGKFGHVLDLARLSADEKFLVPGDPDASEIYLVLTDPNPDFRMPPPDSDAPPVSEPDTDTVREWILGGAGLGGIDPTALSAEAEGEKVSGPASAANPLRIAGRMHPLVVHFPIALILAALGAELLGVREAARWCLWIGALGALGSAGSGWLFAGAEGYSPDTVFRHRWLGVSTAGMAWISVVVLEVTRRGQPGGRGVLLLRMVLLLAAALVGLAGHTGGVLVHGEGFPW